MRCYLLLVLLFVAFSVVGSAAGQVTILLEVEGVPGSSTLEGYQGAMEVSSFSWGASSGTSSTPGGGSQAGRTQFTEIIFIKPMDGASPILLQALTTGRAVPFATVRFIAAGEPPREFSTIRLENVFVARQELSGSSEVPMELVSLVFGRIEWEVCSVEAAGTDAGCNTVTWDVTRNSP
jgi:type VI secretion system secreted protein Hcp